MLNNIYPERFFEQVLPLDKRRYLPPENVFILSIEDFERLVSCLKEGEVDLASLLKKAVTANGDPKTAKMFFSDFLKEYRKQEWSIPRLIQLARDASIARLSSALSGNVK